MQKYDMDHVHTCTEGCRAAAQPRKRTSRPVHTQEWQASTKIGRAQRPFKMAPRREGTPQSCMCVCGNGRAHACCPLCPAFSTQALSSGRRATNPMRKLQPRLQATAQTKLPPGLAGWLAAVCSGFQSSLDHPIQSSLDGCPRPPAEALNTQAGRGQPSAVAAN